MQRIVDTHVHVWDLDRAEYLWLQGDNSILNRTWRIEEIERERREAGITSGVLVQASGNAEDTELMFETAKKTGWISGVVGWLPLMDEQGTQAILDEKYLKERYFKGVRHQIHDEKDPKWLLQPAVINSLKTVASYDLPYDIVAVTPDHIETSLKLAEQIPELKMVFDHLSQPPIAAKERFGKWGEFMKEASRYKNFYAKISGLGTASGKFKDREPEDIKPYIEFALEHFGADRCFCGGDWPVSMLANSYKLTWQTYKGILRDLLSEEDQEKVFYSNAQRFYNLSIN